MGLVMVGNEALGSEVTWEDEEGPEPVQQVSGSPPEPTHPSPQVNGGIYQFCTEIAAYILHLFSGLTAGSNSL